MVDKEKDDGLEAVREAYGFSEKQLLAEFDAAQESLKDEPMSEEERRRIYEKIIKEIEARGIKPKYKDV